MARLINLLLLFLLLSKVHVITAEFVKLCTLRASEIIPITFDEEAREFVVIENVQGADNKTDANRQLRSGDTTAIFVSIERRIQQATSNITGNVFYVRQCLCSTRPWETEVKAFCPLDKTTCGIPRSSNESVGCFNQSSRTSLIRNAWPVIVLWYGGLVIFLLFTSQGRNARHYLIGKCCNRNYNRQLVDQYWYIEGGFWRRRRRRTNLHSLFQFFRRRAEMESEDEVPPLPPNTLDHLVDTHSEHPPNQLALKTKLYAAPHNAVEDEDDLACTICFTPLEDGDRVGALSCKHEFHVECLKNWLPRRNICPLCQAPNAATPQYQPQNHQDEDVNSLVEGGLVHQFSETQSPALVEPAHEESPASWRDRLQHLSPVHHRRNGAEERQTS